MLFILRTRESWKAKEEERLYKPNFHSCASHIASCIDSLSSTEQTSTDHDINKATPMPDIPEEFCTPTKRTRTDTSRRHSPTLKGMPTYSTTRQTSPSANSYYLSKHPAPSMTPEEVKITTHALKRKLESSFDGQTAVFKTRGQSLYIKKVTKPRVPLDKASHSTRKRTARETDCF